MKGKKVDTEFLSAFIVQCASFNKELPSEIAQEAKLQIAQIDEKIKEIENLKILRCKLLDVVYSLDKPIKIVSKEETKQLYFFKIDFPILSKFICESLKEKSIKISSLSNDKHSELDILFCIKQLIEYKIISKINEYIVRGDLFDDYLKFLSRKQ